MNLRAVLPWLLLFGAALAVRSLRAGLVFAGGEVHFPFDLDELYHMRRIWFTVVNFPASLDFDRYVNHPLGAPVVWSPFFDWTIAAIARALVGAGDQHAVEVVAAWAPPVIGALGVLAAAGLARRVFSPAAGFVTGALLAFLPAHVALAEPGQLDHHVAVGLFATLLVGATARLAGPRGADGRPRGAVATGLAAAAAILLWAGALLQVLVVQVFLVAQLVATRDDTLARTRARSLSLAHAIAAVLLAPFCLAHEWPRLGAFSPEVLSRFQPLWFAAGAGALAGTAWLWKRPRLGGDRVRRLLSATAVAGVGVATAWWALPGLAAAVENAAGWFAPDPFLSLVSEIEPLLVTRGHFDASLGSARFTHLFWAYPFFLLGLGWRAIRSHRADRLLLVVTSAAFMAAALDQERFTDVAAAAYAWVTGPALVEGLRVARQRLHAPRFVLAGLVLGACAAALLPAAFTFRNDLRTSLAVREGLPLAPHPFVRMQLVVKRAARWLKQQTPRTAGYLDPGERPEYGVLASWDHGHLLRYYGERPMVQDNFGPWAGSGYDDAGRYFASRDEAEAVAIAGRLRARYVVATPKGSGHGRPEEGSLALRLLPARLPGGALGFRGSPFEALGHHRLVHLEDDADWKRPPGRGPWMAAVYEIVPGARVVGTAPAREPVRFERVLRLPGREPIFYVAATRPDDSGRYEIRLPYASEEGYVVRAGPQRVQLAVAEADVEEGRTVPGPHFEPVAR